MALKTTPSWSSVDAAVDVFADREAESAALAHALEEHRRRNLKDEIDGEVFRNITTFYGVGGVGKTALSNRLERWLTGEWRGDDWPPHPRLPHVFTARWNLHDSHGDVDPVPILLSVRTALHAYKRSWPAFDLAFAAYFTSAHPGQALPVHKLSDTSFADGLVAILGEIAGDVAGSNVVAGLTSSVVRSLVEQVRAAGQKWSATRTNPGVVSLLTRCIRDVSSTDRRPDLAAEVLYQLSLEIAAIAPEHRPILAVFIDHFERLQHMGSGAGERSINRFVASLPYAFFVITGRNLVEWYRDDYTLDAVWGAGVFPGLVPGSSNSESARQHLVGHLSESDARKVIEARLDHIGAAVEEGLVDALATSTGGWPLHIDAVMTHAQRLYERDSQVVLRAASLAGSLETVVERLFSDLPDDERRVFQAGCLLPYFDSDLLRAVAQAESGAVRRCVARTLIADNPGSDLPYRVHDEIRRIVRLSATRLRHGWDDADWADAAGRAMRHLRDRFDTAHDRGDDRMQLFVTALAISVAAENETDCSWILDALKAGPTVQGLVPHIPRSGGIEERMSVRAIVRYVEVLSERADDDVVDALAELSSDPLVGARASLWRAYRLRLPLRRYDDSIEQLKTLLKSHPEHAALYRRQIAVSLIMARRFAEGEMALALLSEVPATRTRALIERAHGDMSGVQDLAARVNSLGKSRRYQLEIAGTLAVIRARAGRYEKHATQDLLRTARDVGHMSAERDALKAVGYTQLFHRKDLDDTLDQIAAADRQGASPAIAELLALRALATGSKESGDRARDIIECVDFRSNSWIAVEFFLVQLGYDIGHEPTQWVRPLDEVTDNWRDVAQRLVHLAGDYA